MRKCLQTREYFVNNIMYEWDITGKSRKQVREFNTGLNRILNHQWFYTVIVKHK